MLALRRQFPRYGKDKLWYLLSQQGLRLSASMIRRLLANLRRRDLLIEPHAVRVRRVPSRRPHPVRAPKAARQPTRPGQVIQLVTVHLQPLPGLQRRQFRAIDVVSRVAMLGVRSTATARTAAFLEEVVARMPMPVAAIQIDGGAEFMADVELACQAWGIAVYVLPPRSPKLNGRVERINGTSCREFWECYDGPLELPELQQALRAWGVAYKTERPHQALGYQTPSSTSPSFCLTCPERGQRVAVVSTERYDPSMDRRHRCPSQPESITEAPVSGSLRLPRHGAIRGMTTMITTAGTGITGPAAVVLRR